jgi:Type VI secretion system (T6SS), amidase effector protein 4
MPNARTVVRTNPTPNSVKEVPLRVITFAELWAAYPHDSSPCKNPATGKPAFDDDCAIRLGTSFEKVGLTNRSFKGACCWYPNHSRMHMLRAEEVAKWLELRPFAGCPKAMDITGEDWEKKAAGQPGIIYFDGYWRRSLDQTTPNGNHIDLWNGSRLTPGAGTTLRFDFGIKRLWNPLSWIGLGQQENIYSDLDKARKILLWRI